MPLWNAWKCRSKESGGVTPARLIVESMDSDHTSRSLTPVALASGGYVDLLNGGWDHQTLTLTLAPTLSLALTPALTRTRTRTRTRT